MKTRIIPRRLELDTTTPFRRGAPLFVCTLCMTATTALANEPVINEPSAFPAPVQPAAEAEWGWSYDPGVGLTFASADGDNSVTVIGRIQNDWAFMSADDGPKSIDPSNPFVDGTEFRRARLGAKGTLYGNVNWKAEYDFVGSNTGFRDVYMGINDVLFGTDFRVGHMKEPFSLEQLTSSKYITFMERSLVDSMVPAYNTGGRFSNHYGDHHLGWAAGVFRDTGDNGTSAQTKDGAYNVTARVYWAPVHNDDASSVVHLGVAGSFRKPESGTGRVRTRPEMRMAPRVLDTGNYASDGTTHAGFEAAWVSGPLSLQGEYVMETINGAAGAPDIDVSGFYGFVSYFLTGEVRPYSSKSGAFGRVKPETNYGSESSGAWELALRYSALDIDAPAVVTAGDLADVTAGVNWYLNPNTRVMFNYVMGDLDSNTDSFDGKLNAFMMRFQIDF